MNRSDLVAVKFPGFVVVILSLLLVLISTEPSAGRVVTRDITDSEGNRYIGQLEDGVKQGYGRYEWVDGRVYEGQYHNNVMHGHGTMTFANGSSYAGTYENGVRHGHGTLILSNGDNYSGSFVSGQFTGQGSFHAHDGSSSFQGGFLNGEYHGFGTLIITNEVEYRGSFKLGLKHGFGVSNHADGTIYRGYFLQDLRHGDGVHISASEEYRFQSWSQGKLLLDELIESVPNCKLTIDDNQWMFSGDQCIDGLAHGKGRAVALDGSAYVNHGTFVLGKLTSGVIIPLVEEEDS